jgi:hypothetical protein
MMSPRTLNTGIMRLESASIVELVKIFPRRRIPDSEM